VGIALRASYITQVLRGIGKHKRGLYYLVDTKLQNLDSRLLNKSIVISDEPVTSPVAAAGLVKLLI